MKKMTKLSLVLLSALSVSACMSVTKTKLQAGDAGGILNGSVQINHNHKAFSLITENGELFEANLSVLALTDKEGKMKNHLPFYTSNHKNGLFQAQYKDDKNTANLKVFNNACESAPAMFTATIELNGVLKHACATPTGESEETIDEKEGDVVESQQAVQTLEGAWN